MFPTLIHQFWHNDDVPYPALSEWIGWRYDYILWTPKSLPDELAQLCNRSFNQVAESVMLRHVSNIVRLWVLERFGGIWLDHDVIPIEPLHTRYPYAASHNTLCNCVLALPAHHPMLLDALQRIESAPPSSSTLFSEVSGERLLQSILTEDVRLRQLPFDSEGNPIADGTNWAVHLYSSSGRMARCR